ncbi:MAG: hypothetical protein L0Y72_18860 [Gemmataceae bacterium]|nr:hypothetical protein [Gemmataceae bacterium]
MIELRRSCRPFVEALEERVAPATLVALTDLGVAESPRIITGPGVFFEFDGPVQQGRAQAHHNYTLEGWDGSAFREIKINRIFMTRPTTGWRS